MNKLILDLLKENGRIIIPDFGALIVKQKSPFKVIFNEFLQYNDGALINALSEKEKITQEDAVVKIKDLTTDFNKKLSSGEHINLPEIGTLSKSPTGKITLTDAGDQVTKPDDSGINSEKGKNTIEFEIQDKSTEEPKKDEPVKETVIPKNQPEKKITPTPIPTPTPKPVTNQATTPINKPEPKPVQQIATDKSQKSETKVQQTPPISEYYNDNSSKNWKSIILWIILIIIVNGAILGFFFFPDEIKAFFGRDKEEMMVTETDESSEEITVAETDTMFEEPVQSTENESELLIEDMHEETTEVQTENQIFSGTKYYVVAGVFREESNADNLVQKLRNKGYNAEKFGKIGQMYAVSYDVFPTKREADNYMMKIRQEVDKDAWIRILD